MENINNCLNCLYSNEIEGRKVMCDKRLLSEYKEVFIEANKTELPCPAHSSKYIEETRYMRNNKWLHESEDGEYCGVCRRKVNLDDISLYNYIKIQNEDGKEVEKMQCRICKGKGRR